MKIETTTNILYILLFAVIYLCLAVFKIRHVRRRDVCILIGILLFIGLAFRSLDQGLNDTRDVYLGMYKLSAGYSWSALYQSMISKMTSPLFVSILKVLSVLFINNFRCVIILFAAIYIFCFEKLIYTHCKDAAIANAFFIAFFYPYGFFLMRQCLSMALIAYALCALNSKKRLRAVVVTMIACLIHSVAIVFVACVTVAYIAIKKLKLSVRVIQIIALVVTVVMVVAPSFFSVILEYLPSDSKYSILLLNNIYAKGDIWWTPFIVSLIEMFILFFYYRRADNTLVLVSLTSSIFAALFIATTGIIQDMVRISYYFQIPCIYLVGNMEFVKIKKKNMAKLVNASFVAILVLYAVLNTLPNSNIISWG